MKYGFDERETWSLDYTMAKWISSRLKMYLLYANKMVDLTCYKFDIPVLEDIPEEERTYSKCKTIPDAFQREVIKKDSTEKECVEIAMKYLEFYTDDMFDKPTEFEIRHIECAKCAMKIIAEIFPTLWW